MAHRLIQENLCDWHSALQAPAEVEAVHSRVNPQGKENDLCEPCAMIFDWLVPRFHQVLTFFDHDVLEALFRAGRTPADETPARPAQLAITESDGSPMAVAPAPKPEPKKPPGKAAAEESYGHGEWQPGVEQVRCPLTHRVGSPAEYWVRVRDRGSHAKSSHKLLGPQVAWELPDPERAGDEAFDLPVKCFEHKVCAEAGGYGFENENGLRLHRIKTAQWEKTPMRKDATETPRTPAASAA
ncbi:hypothetical protein ACWEDZ_02750 [Streptomyces sp. NPDC005047]